MEQIKTLEDLYESIGGFGRFQFFAIITVLYPELPAALLVLLPVFTGVQPTAWKCVVERPAHTQINESAIAAAARSNIFEYFVNGTGSGGFLLTNTDESELDLANGAHVQNNDLCACEGTLLGVGDYSIVSEWSLVCDYAWVADFMTSVQMAGMMIGGPAGSQIADRIGRKKSLYLFCFVMFLMGITSPFVQSPFIYAAARFVLGIGTSSYLLIGTLYPIEILTPKWRTLTGAIGPWSIGSILLALLASYIAPWQTLSWVAALPMALTLVTYPFLPESPRWLLNKGRPIEAKKALDTIARWNRRDPVDAKLVEALACATQSEFGDESGNAKRPQPQPLGFTQFLTNAHLRLKTIIFICTFFTVAIISYGIIFNLKNIGGDIYLNLVYISVLEFVGFGSAMFVNGWLGRRKAFLVYMLLGSVPLVGIILMELQVAGLVYSEFVVTCLALAGRFFVGGAWASVKGFAAESFPTETRSTAMGITTIAAALGGVAAPQMVFLGTIYRPIPYFVFGTLAVCSTFLSLLLPETGGKPLQAD